MSHPYYLTETSLKGFACSAGSENHVRAFGETIRQIEARCGADVASLFAEPVPPSNVDSDNPKLSWYTSADGRAIELGSIDETARGPIVATLRSRLERLKPILEEPGIGSKVASWLYVPGPNSILAVGGTPVLIDWGFLPAEAANSRPAREAHFNATIGRYAPDLKLPPFTREEQEFNEAQLRRHVAPQTTPVTSSALSPRASETGSTPFESSEPVRASKSNWKAPLIAASIAAAVLAFLAWPGVLRKPERINQALLQRQEAELRDSNKSLEEKLRLIEGQSRDKVCRAADGKPPPLVPLGPDGKPVPRQDQLPPPINKVDIKPPGANTQMALPAFFEQVVVNIRGPVDDKRVAIGSGFFINATQVVTNRHVVERIRPGKIVLTNKSIGTELPAKIVAISDPDPQQESKGMSHEDLAVLEVSSGNHTFMPVGPSPTKMQDIFAIGYPGYLRSDDMTIERGIVTTKPSRTVPTIIHSAKIAPGNSGGPIADLCGRAIGVNTQIPMDKSTPVVGYLAQDVSVLVAFLSKHGIKSSSDSSADCPAQVRPEPEDPGKQGAQKTTK